MSNKCSFCGNENVTFTRSNGQALCADCYERFEVHHYCADCGVKIIGDAAETNADGEIICTDCGQKYAHCGACGSIVHDDEYQRRDGRTLCSECGRSYFFCTDCGEIVNYTNGHNNGHDRLICTSCFNEYYHYCDHCGDVVANDESISIDGGRLDVCEDCAESYYYHCDDCGEYISARRLWTDRNMTICDDCCGDYCICYDCDGVVHSDDVHYINGYYYCDDCAASHRTVIHDYDFKPVPEFYGELSEWVKGYYGLELEIDDGNDRREAARSIQDAGGDRIYLKHDGSLTSAGFEIVTHPATLEYHMDHMPWDNIISAARDYDYTSHDAGTCGLHIHASRLLFGAGRTTQDLNIAKTILLIDFWWEQYIVPFSRRNYHQLNDWAKKPNAQILPTDNEPEAVDKAIESGERNRYKAVNLKNRHTVEFRFFRGTLRRDTIIASIQFIDTLIKYVSDVELADLWDKTWADVFGDTEYPELKDYLQKRKLMDEREEI